MSSDPNFLRTAWRGLTVAALVAAFAAAVAACAALPGPPLMAAKVHLLAGFAGLELALGWALAARRSELPCAAKVVGDSAQQEIGTAEAPRSDEWLVGFRKRSSTSDADEFLGALSGEIWAPLQGVISMLDLMMDSPLGSGQRAQLGLARGAVQSLSLFIQDLLDLTLLEQGLIRPAMRPVEVRPLIAGAIDDLRPRAGARSLDLRWSADSQLPRLLVADSLRLRQVISALAGDAVNRAGAGAVHLAAGWQPDECRLVLTATFSGLAGDSLALRLVRGLADLHAGELKIAAAGSSVCYTFSMPLRVPAAAGPQEPAGAAGQENLSRPVLLVEDNLINQKVITSLLRKKGYRVDVASHGGEALEMLERSNYRLILMDIQMPVLDGLETTQRIRSSRDWAGLPIIAMTAHAMNGDRERCLEAGMNEYIPKPVDHKLLLDLIERYLAGSGGGRDSAAPAQAGPPHIPHLMSLFNELAPNRIERLKRAASEGDLAMLGADAARIQGAARTLASPGLLACALSLDEAVHRADLEAIRASLAGLEAEVSSLPPAPARPPNS